MLRLRTAQGATTAFHISGCTPESEARVDGRHALNRGRPAFDGGTQVPPVRRKPRHTTAAVGCRRLLFDVLRTRSSRHGAWRGEPWRWRGERRGWLSSTCGVASSSYDPLRSALNNSTSTQFNMPIRFRKGLPAAVDRSIVPRAEEPSQAANHGLRVPKRPFSELATGRVRRPDDDRPGRSHTHPFRRRDGSARSRLPPSSGSGESRR